MSSTSSLILAFMTSSANLESFTARLPTLAKQLTPTTPKTSFCRYPCSKQDATEGFALFFAFISSALALLACVPIEPDDKRLGRVSGLLGLLVDNHEACPEAARSMGMIEWCAQTLGKFADVSAFHGVHTKLIELMVNAKSELAQASKEAKTTVLEFVEARRDVASMALTAALLRDLYS